MSFLELFHELFMFGWGWWRWCWIEIRDESVGMWHEIHIWVVILMLIGMAWWGWMIWWWVKWRMKLRLLMGNIWMKLRLFGNHIIVGVVTIVKFPSPHRFYRDPCTSWWFGSWIVGGWHDGLSRNLWWRGVFIVWWLCVFGRIICVICTRQNVFVNLENCRIKIGWNGL